MIRNNIENFCRGLGLDLIGFVRCREFIELRDFLLDRKKLNLENPFEEEILEKRINPLQYLNEGKTIISIAFPYLHNYEYKENGFSVYTRGEDYHKVVNSYLEKICGFIETLGGKAERFVDSNPLPERYIAYLSGIGFIGKNNMLITKQYGSYVFLGEIITDLVMESYDDDGKHLEDLLKFKECGICDLCYKNCPTKSINKNKKNSNICLSFITQKKDIDDKWFNILNGRIFGCDTCQKVCPFNKYIKYSGIKEFYPLDFMNENLTDKLITITKGDFNKSIKLTSCGWRGKNVLSRNSIIRKYALSKEEIEEGIYNMKFQSSYLEEYKNRILDLSKTE
ncbi:tRNA epoxyqueuosine(34) reductase QueG [Clostridium fallax]|uniref:Epoxyqueuosine reductase n=1 Tax=Clostridium fallax TaxID=1533 RepID=A0A1M4SS18_9CLOT|nr:tRNA epoxyqueuosine(34) reductase QueG [Clostridium fallax]SHE34986.1 epoxyqueuosine reductase [Clostridium fallax]SQB07942.1 iron-sulfur cluster-binding protein [Clostridium fallax]